jgi:sulfoxide reductase catalytic subunit YedY
VDKIASSEITPEQTYVSRRSFLIAATAVAGTLALRDNAAAQPGGSVLETVPGPFSTSEPANTWEHVTSYNNFYEFGTAKSDPARYAPRWQPPSPWTVSIEGECAKPGTLALEDILKGETLEDRVYRLRCVEGWSMVIPWVGFPLANLLKRCGPTSKARFVELTTIADRSGMPGLSSDVLDWPYVEGLRMDEAMHPLTLLGVGVYGRRLPNQNGAPLRLVVPWKYGFKSVKSIARIRFVERQPTTAWMRAYPQAYGFFANVNPTVEHPKWSQRTEQRLPAFFKNTRTQLFNGYGEQVASLYSGMDLRRNY